MQCRGHKFDPWVRKIPWRREWLPTPVFFFLIFFYFNWRLITLQYCIGFAIINMNLPRVYTSSPSWTSLTSLPILSLWVIPVHQPQASCVLHWTWTSDSFHIWYYTCFNAILPNHPTLSLFHRVQRPFCTSLFLLLSRIQGYRYHFSKFHIYSLVYCIGVLLSGLLHSV